MKSKSCGDARRDQVFSCTTDLYSIVANAYSTSIVPVSLVDIAALLAVTMLPFLPVVVMSVPTEIIVEQITGLLF